MCRLKKLSDPDNLVTRYNKSVQRIVSSRSTVSFRATVYILYFDSDSFFSGDLITTFQRYRDICIFDGMFTYIICPRVDTLQFVFCLFTLPSDTTSVSEGVHFFPCTLPGHFRRDTVYIVAMYIT